MKTRQTAIRLYFFVATQRGYGDLKGGLVLKEHEAARWQAREQLGEVEWLPADVTLIEKVGDEMGLL